MGARIRSLADGLRDGILVGGTQIIFWEVVVIEDSQPDKPRRRLFGHDHQKRSLRTWVIPLLVIVAIIFFLPRLVGLLEK